MAFPEEFEYDIEHIGHAIAYSIMSILYDCANCIKQVEEQIRDLRLLEVEPQLSERRRELIEERRQVIEGLENERNYNVVNFVQFASRYQAGPGEQEDAPPAERASGTNMLLIGLFITVVVLSIRCARGLPEKCFSDKNIPALGKFVFTFPYFFKLFFFFL